MSPAPHTPYLELRALAEDLAEAASATERRQLTAALTHWLACHCASCGALLLWVERRARKPITICLACELADIPPPPNASDDMPF